jgi:hypothetical protein
VGVEGAHGERRVAAHFVEAPQRDRVLLVAAEPHDLLASARPWHAEHHRDTKRVAEHRVHARGVADLEQRRGLRERQGPEVDARDREEGAHVEHAAGEREAVAVVRV